MPITLTSITLDNSGIAGPEPRANQTWAPNAIGPIAVGTSETVICKPMTHGRPITITGKVGGSGALSGLAVYKLARNGGTAVLVASGTDFNTATHRFPATTNNAYTTAAGSTFSLDIDAESWAGVMVTATGSTGSETLTLEIGIGVR